MSQLDNFRNALKKHENTNEPTAPDLSQEQVQTNGNASINRKETRTKQGQQKMKRTSIGLPGEIHEKLKVISLWMKREGIKDNPGLVDTVNELVDFYLSEHPSAEKFLEMFYTLK